MCTSAETSGGILVLNYADPISYVVVFNRVNCLSCADRIVGSTFEGLGKEYSCVVIGNETKAFCMATMT